ncbi:MAG: NAD(P)/FAD-dependent oxidoreductase, partial [Brevinema sp.]
CKFNLDYRVGGDVYVLTGKNIVDNIINDVVEIYRKLGSVAEPVGNATNPIMDKIKRRCIENRVQLVETPVMHLGTDGSRTLYTALIEKLKSYPYITFETSCDWEDILTENGEVKGVLYQKDGNKITALASNVVIAVGRSGASKMMSVAEKHGINFEHGGVDIGVRAEIPDVVMQQINENYYEAKMIYYTSCHNDKMRTFCSNPSGFVAVEKHDDNTVLANGHAYKNKKSTNTNLALLCTQKFTQPFDQPFAYAKSIAQMSAMLTGGKILCQSFADLMVGRRSTDDRLSRLNIRPTASDYVAGDISLACPKRILDNIIEFIEVHGHITPGFASADLLLYFPEIKFRSVRMQINEHMETSIKGLYSAGDSSGYGSGLNQAAVMGILAARRIVSLL